MRLARYPHQSRVRVLRRVGLVLPARLAWSRLSSRRGLAVSPLWAGGQHPRQREAGWAVGEIHRLRADSIMNFDVLRLDLIEQLCTSHQWIGGPDSAYYALRERTILQVDAILPVIRLHEAGTACRCAGPVGIHATGSTGCLRS